MFRDLPEQVDTYPQTVKLSIPRFVGDLYHLERIYSWDSLRLKGTEAAPALI